MKKLLLSLTLLFGLFCAPVMANDQGLLFDLGATGLVKIYPYEQVSYVYNWDSGFTLGAEMRVMENVIRSSESEPYCYFMPGMVVAYKNAYLSVGPAFFDNMTSIKQTLFYVRAGYRFSPWELKTGKLGLDFGIDASPTFYIIDAEGDNNGGSIFAAAFASTFLSILNVCKLNVGVTWYLPF